jgi:uncharacterized protein YjbI with pentapeptide repeats
MTRLDDRLTRIEEQLDTIQALLTQLLETAQVGSLAGVDVQPEALIEVEPPVEAAPAPVDEDPLEIQYQLALGWAEGNRAEDLAEFDLAGRNLRNIDLKDAQLTRADLSKADLTGAKLSRAQLSGADLSKAQLVRADLSRAVLEEADLTFANLNYAKLERASLRYALLTRANLSGANLSGIDFGGAQLNRANLTRANLKGAHIHHRQLASASSLDGATMPDGRLYDGDPEPYKVNE